MVLVLLFRLAISCVMLLHLWYDVIGEILGELYKVTIPIHLLLFFSYSAYIFFSRFHVIKIKMEVDFFFKKKRDKICPILSHYEN